MEKLKLFFLGPPRVERDGILINFESRKALALFVYLAVTNKNHSRDALSTLFWGEYDQKSSRSYLRHALWALRKALGESWLQIQGDLVGLSVEKSLIIDVVEFQGLLEKAAKHEHSKQEICTSCLDWLEAATACYKDDFLAGFSLPDSPEFDDWQYYEREELRQGLATALQHLVDGYTYQGKVEPALVHARRWTSLDPFHEIAQRKLMELYALSGQQAAALRQYEEFVQRLKTEFNLVPEEETVNLYKAVKARKIAPGASIQPNNKPEEPDTDSQPAPAVDRPPFHNLPKALARIIGRENESGALIQLLVHEPALRLVTLMGPGGIGKTSLAVQAAYKLTENDSKQFPDGVWFISLAQISEAGLIETTIAKAINYSFYSEKGHQRQQLLDYLSSKRMLLILDNFEHLLSSESLSLINDLLSAAPEIKLLVTSRVRLNIQEEQLFPISGLAIPPKNSMITQEQVENMLSEYSGLRLFYQRANLVRPDFTARLDSFPAVVKICQILDGIPLAIEMAAAWIQMLSPQEILLEIENSIDFLEANWHDIPERQRSIRAVLDSSWILLDEVERRTLQGLAVFQGSFSREAVTFVTGTTIKTLLGLANKSWLQPAEKNRYQLHELLLQYASEKLNENEVIQGQHREKHAQYYAKFLENHFDQFKEAGQREALQEVTEEFDNIRAAAWWLVNNKQFEPFIDQMLPALYRYSESPDRSFELIRLIERAHEILDNQTKLEGTKNWTTILKIVRSIFFINDYPLRFLQAGLIEITQTETLREAWTSVTRYSIDTIPVFWKTLLGYAYGRCVNLKAGLEFSLGLLPQINAVTQVWELAYTHQMIGRLLLDELHGIRPSENARIQAREHLTKALDIFQSLGDEWECGWTLHCLGSLVMGEQSAEEAINFWQAAQNKLENLGEWGVAADLNTYLGNIHLRLGMLDEAFAYFQTASRKFLEKGHDRGAAYCTSKESYEALRYSSIEHAMETRQKSLALSKKANDLFGEAWSIWELGEIHRVAGDIELAKNCFEHARALFEEIEEPNSDIFHFRAMGDIAQAEGNYSLALQNFQRSFESAQTLNHTWGTVYSFVGLGRASLGLQESYKSVEYLRQAIQIVKRIGDPGLALLCAVVYAEIEQALGHTEKAADYCRLILDHRLAWQETKKHANNLLANLNSASQKTHAYSRDSKTGLSVWELMEEILLA